MILLVAVVVLVAVVPLAGGRLGALADLRISAAWLLFAALALQVAVLTVPVAGGDGVHRLAHLASYGLAAAFVARNRALPGLWLLAAGGASNAAAITANGGVMPATPSAFSTAGIDRLPPGMANSAPSEDAPLWFLGDVFALPAAWPLATVFSVGDMALVAGAAVLLWRVCGCGRSGRSAPPRCPALARDSRADACSVPPGRLLQAAGGDPAHPGSDANYRGYGSWLYARTIVGPLRGRGLGAGGLRRGRSTARGAS